MIWITCKINELEGGDAILLKHYKENPYCLDPKFVSMSPNAFGDTHKNIY